MQSSLPGRWQKIFPSSFPPQTILVLRGRAPIGQHSSCWPNGARPLVTRMTSKGFISSEVSRKICDILLFEFEKIVFKIVVELMSRRMKNLLTSPNMWVQICSVFDARQKNRQIDRRWCSFLFTSLFWDFHCISQTNVLLIILIWQAWCKQGKKRTPDRRLGAWLKTSDGTMRNGRSC